jgi:site-specific DNA recombinase
MNKDGIFALYARVSSDKQAKDKTIDSQVAALKDKITADGGTLIEDMMFIDAGVSGATLVRPALERLRDSAAIGAVDRIYFLSPDRLAREYAHQALLLEEFASAGVTVHFLNHALGTTPEEELLLQMQGMIAEYERAKIIERHRRGKLHRAKGGSVNVLSTAPYGYTYIRKQVDGEPAQYIVKLQQAKTVRQVFHWIGVERLSIGEVCRRLSEAEIPTQTGKTHWDRSVIWGMLQNPAYMGRAGFGKTKAGKLEPRVRPQKHSAETPKKPYSTQRTDRDTWIEIPVPPLVSEELFQAVQHQLDENRKRARIGSRGACYLLQGLTVCGHCHYAYYGKKISPATAKGKRQYAYYRCIGTDAYRFGGERICDNKQVRTERLDDVVWAQVLNAIKHPKRLKKEYENRLNRMEGDARDLFDSTALTKQKALLEKGKSRLIDSYASSIIDKDEFEPKIKTLKIKLAQIDEQIEQSIKTEGAQHELFLVINRLEEFAKKVDVTLDAVDFNTKREIIRALVKRVEIYKEEVVVVFRIDPEAPANDATSCTSPQETGGSIMHSCNRRSFTGTGEHLPSLCAGLVVRAALHEVLSRQSVPGALLR